MSINVLALGLDPRYADFSQMTGFTPAMVQSYIDAQLQKVRELGYYVESCLVDTGDTAEEVTRLHIESRTFDCVLFGAGLRAAPHLLLLEKLINLVHARAPLAKICFNTNPADSAEAVQRWV